MRTYEDPLQPVDDWYVTSVINLDDDGRFRYCETWSCYAGSTDSRAEGRWRQTDNVVVLETERIEGGLQLRLEVGRDFHAIERGDRLDFGNDLILHKRGD